MATKKLTNEFMEKILNDSAWKELPENFAWTEQMLEKHKNKVDWKEISNNNNIVWTPAMLDKFKKFIDWKELSSTDCETILTEDCLEQFEDYWDWAKLINRWHGDKLYNADFLERYADNIPSSQLQDSRP